MLNWIINQNWLAIEASMTLSGVNTIENWGNWLLSEPSEWDSIRGGQLKIGYVLYIYISVCMDGTYVP